MLRTVGVSFEKLVPDAAHSAALRDAVCRVHGCTMLATELLNLYVRDRLENHGGSGLEHVMEGNWLLNAYYEVTRASSERRKAKVEPALRATRDAHMPPFQPVDRTGLSQILKYECKNLATVASNNVWMHFRSRLLSHVRLRFALPEAEYKALSDVERRQRRLRLMQLAFDLARPPSEPPRRAADSADVAWIGAERARLGIDAAVGNWDGKTIEYHLKARPHRFLQAMYLMTAEREAEGHSAFALFPLRRRMVPRHVRLDQTALRQLLKLGVSDYEKEKQKESRKRRKTQAGRVDHGAPSLEAPKRVHRSKEAMIDEKAALFGEVLNLRAAGLKQRDRFDWAFTTDGVCARLQCAVRKPVAASSARSGPPRRGRFAIDELKRESRLALAELHVVGVDPGKRELVHAVDQDEPTKTAVRYTLQQRQRDLRTRQYAAEQLQARPVEVGLALAELAECNSRASKLDTFKAYCEQRRKRLDACLAHYAALEHRRRRWKTAIKTQQSEERLYKRLRALHRPDDRRTLVLAYGSWGAVAGRPGQACNRGNPPCVGVGLMNRLAKRFVIAVTPEQYTSKTCCKCLHPCGPWVELEQKMGRKVRRPPPAHGRPWPPTAAHGRSLPPISSHCRPWLPTSQVRGLRVCQNEECKLPQNRDRTGAANIGLQFCRLYEGKGPIRAMSDEDLAFQSLNVGLCAECPS